MVQQRHLHQEFTKGPCLDVIIVSLADATTPGVRGTIAGNIEVEGGKDDTLALENLIALITALGHEDKLVHRGSEDLFILGGDEHRGNANKLELNEGHHLHRE